MWIRMPSTPRRILTWQATIQRRNTCIYSDIKWLEAGLVGHWENLQNDEGNQQGVCIANVNSNVKQRKGKADVRIQLIIVSTINVRLINTTIVVIWQEMWKLIWWHWDNLFLFSISWHRRPIVCTYLVVGRSWKK